MGTGAWVEVHPVLLCFCSTGDAEIGSNNVNSLKSEDFHMRGLLDELNEDDIWGSSLKSCGKAVSIETASLSEYARYVLRTICQQVICKTTLLSSFGETMLFYLKSITHTLLQNDCRSISVFEFCLGFLVWTIYVLNRMLLGGKKLLWLVISISLHSDRTEVFFLPESQAL